MVDNEDNDNKDNDNEDNDNEDKDNKDNDNEDNDNKDNYNEDNNNDHDYDEYRGPNCDVRAVSQFCDVCLKCVNMIFFSLSIKIDFYWDLLPHESAVDMF